ncbi:STELLO glycosyltransferase family protein [Rhizobium sp. DKSPLA3]|uniref:STELLO glycosyltransferase family protein n=1 Tax=Rhizobium quercicola TaxID=2901226 RepID=A0A9X1NSU8_9HYPH|nr:STELLO glycosyltransferase family protein [Rhizobium quercicola]MCD7109685.1 STELLO glycosyltransferase family protein [Rhizobium quercicola]
MKSNISVVVTSINPPTKALKDIATDGRDFYSKFIVIGDTKSPADFSLNGCEYYSVDDQTALEHKLARIAPTKHYARKNIGYLEAIARGAEIIVETDDDNIPLPEFWAPRERKFNSALATGGRWYNAYNYFSDGPIWPRGLPLEDVKAARQTNFNFTEGAVDSPIQQGLADDDPDVDAVYRFLFELPVKFDKGKIVALEKGVWCPFNSQNTTWWRDAFPLMYLPFNCSWRVCDIWRSLIAQRIGWECGWKLSFHSASVYQDRNAHDLLRDFAEEVPGYLNNNIIVDKLIALNLLPGKDNLLENLRRCYLMLIEEGLVGRDEQALLEAWSHDIASLT